MRYGRIVADVARGSGVEIRETGATMQSIQSIGLTGIILIDIAIGVIFAILTFALISSALYEAISGVLNFRGNHLRTGILRLLEDKEMQGAVLKHPLIQSLRGPRTWVEALVKGKSDEDRMPSSIPKATFAKAMVEGLIKRKNTLIKELGEADEQIEKALTHVGHEIDKLALDDRLKARLKGIVKTVDLTKEELGDEIERKLREVEAELADWFDKSMDRVTGWYVRRTKTMLFFLGFLMAFAVNFDVIGYSQELARNDALRAQVLAEAQATAESGKIGVFSVVQEVQTAPDGSLSAEEFEKLKAAARNVADTATAGLDQIQGTFGDSAAVIGWDGGIPDLWGLIRMVVSWLIIGLGCTLGGQFWFDLLKNFIKVRAGASGVNSDIKNIQIAVSGGQQSADGQQPGTS